MSIQFSVTANGLPELTAKLDKLADPAQREAPLRDAAGKIIAEAQIYPPELPNQQYIRTYTLRGGWAYQPMQTSGSTAWMTVENPVEYAPYVMGTADQAPLFQGRWKTLEAIGQEQEPLISAVFAAWLQSQAGTL